MEGLSDAEDANEAQEVHIYKPALEGSPQMTEMNAQEKLLLKQLGQRFQLGLRAQSRGHRLGCTCHETLEWRGFGDLGSGT